MKCLQKSCQRNKHIDVRSGLCNVCQEVVKDTTEKFKEVSKMNPKKVEVDFAEMVKMHHKLSKGQVNDPTAVSGLILGVSLTYLLSMTKLRILSLSL
jgi:hypothetical protein